MGYSRGKYTVEPGGCMEHEISIKYAEDMFTMTGIEEHLEVNGIMMAFSKR